MHSLKQKLTDFCIFLKQRPWTHVLAWLEMLVFIPFIILIIFLFYMMSKNSSDIIVEVYVCIIAVVAVYLGANVVIIIVTFLFTLINTLLKQKIKNNFLLTNPVYHIFWLTGLGVTVIVNTILIILYIYDFITKKL